MKKVFALIDCNNFYASCERLFRPELRDKPIVVLSWGMKQSHKSPAYTTSWHEIP